MAEARQESPREALLGDLTQAMMTLAVWVESQGFMLDRVVVKPIPPPPFPASAILGVPFKNVGEE